MKRYAPLFVVMVLVLAACAAGPNPALGTPPIEGSPAGFWLGLWHGAIFMIAFFISLFTDDVTVYEVFNNGNWYDFGYFLGIVIFVGGSHGARTAAR